MKDPAINKAKEPSLSEQIQSTLDNIRKMNEEMQKKQNKKQEPKSIKPVEKERPKTTFKTNITHTTSGAYKIDAPDGSHEYNRKDFGKY